MGEVVLVAGLPETADEPAVVVVVDPAMAEVDLASPDDFPTACTIIPMTILMICCGYPDDPVTEEEKDDFKGTVVLMMGCR